MAAARLLTTTEVAEIADVSARTVLRWVERDELPIAHQLPGRTGALLFDPSVVKAFLAEQGNGDGHAKRETAA